MDPPWINGPWWWDDDRNEETDVSETKHAAGPVEARVHDRPDIVRAVGGGSVAHCGDETYHGCGNPGLAAANAARFAACWNACIEMEDPAAAIREAREALQEAIHTHEVQMEMFPPNEVGHGVVRGSWLNTPDKLRSALAKLGGASC